jgi:uncharacterized repeat protein (TIGR03803 family)
VVVHLDIREPTAEERLVMMKIPIPRLLAFTSLILMAAAGHSQTVSMLYDFGIVSGDPLQPYVSGIVAQGRDGNLYTASPLGGAIDAGTVFKMTPGGQMTVLHSFVGDGAYTTSGLTLGRDGNFYGGGYSGGTFGAGTLFKITPSGTLTVLYNFTGGSDGEYPYAPPVQGADGNFYGTTSYGATNGFGTVYKVTSSGNLTTLYDFDSTHGANPYSPLVQGMDGNLYGTTALGGAYNCGTVYKITTAGRLTVLFNFDGAHGQNPYSPLIQGSDGNFYGTASAGGDSGGGVVFKMTPAGAVTILHSFVLNNVTDGFVPLAGLIQATNGNLYGVTSQGGIGGGYGTIFQVADTGVYSVLYTFDSTSGGYPTVTPMQHTSGVLYGDTTAGGASTVCGNGGCGTFYSLNAGLAPFVRLLSTSGKVGTTIQMLGQGFNGATAVSFNGVPASYKVVTDTYLTATVPNRATTGAVSVSEPSGTLTSNQSFRVLPSIKSFSPGSGAVGTSVVVTGVSLTQTTKVTFGGVAATSFAVNSDTQATATVPAGAKTGRITVTTPGGTATSAATFTVTM